MLIFIILLANECYAYKSSLRIYGGEDANIGQYPYIVRMEVQRFINFTNNTVIAQHEHFCSGSALSPIWVLSAAHCIISPKYMYIGLPYNIENVVIRYGHVANSPWTEDSFCSVLDIVQHPMYEPKYPVRSLKTQAKHDILLYKTSPMNIASYIKLSAVDYKTLYGHEAVLAGFGFTTKSAQDGKEETETTLSLRKPLQTLKTSITKCGSYDYLIPGFCLASKCGKISTVCVGDSGGPLIHSSGLIGVLSKGVDGGNCLNPPKKLNTHTAGAVVSVSPYIEWIYSHMNAPKTD